MDEHLNKRNLTFRQTYWLRYDGKLEDLRVEVGEGAGFVSLPAAVVFALTPENAAECIAGLFHEDYQPCWQALRVALDL